MKGRWEEFRKKYWPPKKDQLFILVLLGLLLAVIAIPVEEKKERAVSDMDVLKGEASGAASAATSAESGPGTYESRMEDKLEELLAQVEGVGRVRVMLTLEGTGEKTVEKDKEISQESSREETVYAEYGSSERMPYVTAETNPKVDGVLVIAEGGGDSRIKAEIMEAAEALFGIEPHKIKIMKMEGSK